MKSSRQQLASRGFVSNEELAPFQYLPMDECIALLKSSDPRERTISARILASYRSDTIIKLLADRLALEDKLYTRIALCETLASFGRHSSKILCGLLGRIGSNQHETVPDKDFMKKSYPLPRDIAARTLAAMGTEVLSDLVDVLTGKNLVAIREAIDAIGHICFNHHTDQLLEHLIRCLEKNHEDTIIRWKIVRALSAFHNPQATDLLKKFTAEDPEKRIRREAGRSLQFSTPTKYFL